MYSAFGVDHGYEEIEKWEIPGMAAMGGGLARGASKMSGKLVQVGQRNALHTGTSGLMPKLGGLQRSAGAGLGRLAGGMAARPGLTGGIATGTALGSAGLAGAASGRRRI